MDIVALTAVCGLPVGFLYRHQPYQDQVRLITRCVFAGDMYDLGFTGNLPREWAIAKLIDPELTKQMLEERGLSLTDEWVQEGEQRAEEVWTY